MNDKIKVSSNWTDEERLIVISEFSVLLITTPPNDITRIRDIASCIHKISVFSAGFLERNRKNFSEVIE